MFCGKFGYNESLMKECVTTDSNVIAHVTQRSSQLDRVISGSACLLTAFGQAARSRHLRQRWEASCEGWNNGGAVRHHCALQANGPSAVSCRGLSTHGLTDMYEEEEFYIFRKVTPFVA